MEVVDLRDSGLTADDAAALIGRRICRVIGRSDELTLVLENGAELQIKVGTWTNPEALLVDLEPPKPHATYVIRWPLSKRGLEPPVRYDPGDASQDSTT